MTHEHHDKLHDAGLIDKHEVPKEQLDRIASLSKEEVESLIKIKEKLNYQGKITDPDTSFF